MHLVQLNIGRLVADPESVEVAEFMFSLEAINLLGASYPGFVWMLKDEDGPGAVGQRYPGSEDDRRVIVNLTVWSDFDSLRHFVTRSGHSMYLRRRLEWFERASVPTTVLWWIDEGHRPNLIEAAERLDELRESGPGPTAFDMTTTFPAP